MMLSDFCHSSDWRPHRHQVNVTTQVGSRGINEDLDGCFNDGTSQDGIIDREGVSGRIRKDVEVVISSDWTDPRRHEDGSGPSGELTTPERSYYRETRPSTHES